MPLFAAGRGYTCDGSPPIRPVLSLVGGQLSSAQDEVSGVPRDGVYARVGDVVAVIKAARHRVPALPALGSGLAEARLRAPQLWRVPLT
jgi:hypothetical protein